MRCVKILKIWGKKRQWQDRYDGILIKQDKAGIEFIGCGPEKSSRIKEHYFNKTDKEEKFLIIGVSEETVEHYFRLSILKASNELNDAQFELLDRKKELTDANAFYKRFFKGDL